jgi:[acyl-carrier-protein] S-malonyltransferase
MTARDDTLVATVAGMPVPLAWVDERLDELRRGRLGRQLLPMGPDVERVRRWIVQVIVDRVVEQHEAREAGLSSDTHAAVANGDARLPAFVGERLFERVTAGVTIPEEDVRAYYARNIDRYERPETRGIRYAIAPSAVEARAAFESLVAAGLPAPSASLRQGELSGVRRGELSGPLEQAVFDAAVGDVVGPFPFAGGWMAARVEAVMPASTAALEEVGPTIEAELLRAARARAYEEWIASRRAALVVIEPAYEHPGHPIHGLPTHRH